jgi:hypothetical protein
MFAPPVSRILVFGVVLAANTSTLLATDLIPEEIVARHVDSIGTPEVRNAARTRIVQGTVQFKIRVGGGGELRGTSAFVSEGRKSVLMLKLRQQRLPRRTVRDGWGQGLRGGHHLQS